MPNQNINLESVGIKNVKEIFHNLSYEDIYMHEIEKKEVQETSSGSTSVDTGKFTGRSPKDKYFVKQSPSEKHIWWGPINKPADPAVFEDLHQLAIKQIENKSLYVFDGFCGASDKSKVKVRFISEIAWQHHFVTNMFIRPKKNDLENFIPDFTIINACKIVDSEWEKHHLNSEVFVIFNIEKKLAIIGGTSYGGEMKKGIFSMMNYWLPLKGILSMHCSANKGKDGDTALFFGLSGTGKTTLSADPNRKLIGDDEHGWDDSGVFNFEGGCYAKTIDLDPTKEPDIYNAIKRDALLENVVIDSNNKVNFTDGSKTENTRVSYPIYHIENHEPSGRGEHPSNIIFLTCDAYGVLPPISRLTPDQAMYHYLSGYTAKVAGTERGITEPTATFSACFGAAFLPLHPTQYAKLLGEKLRNHNVNAFLVNTGWSGGVYGTGKRMAISITRACVNSILDGSVLNAKFTNHPIFKIAMPDSIANVPADILHPINTWEDKTAYDKTAKKLADMFIKNFEQYQDTSSDFDFSSHGPAY